MYSLKKYIAMFLTLILLVLMPFSRYMSIISYADDAIATQNPLFIPITSLVTAVALGSGIIAKNSADAISAGNQLVNNVISNIKSSEIQKVEEDSNYDSPYRVINGGQPEKPNNDNKNGKWVALGGGAIASGELWANKDTVIDIMQKINSIGGYNQQNISSGLVTADKFKSTANLSNVCLQLANISNSALTQFNDFIHSDRWLSQNIDTDDCYFAVNVKLSDIYAYAPKYPTLNVCVFHSEQNLDNLNITKNLYSYGLFSNYYGSLNRYYSNGESNGIMFLNQDNVNIVMDCWNYDISSRNAGGDLSISGGKISGKNNYDVRILSNAFYNTDSAFCGYIGVTQSPFQFTNNVYNVNVQFDENFQNWMQEQIQILGQGLMDAVKVGITTINPSWNPTQEQIQTGVTPESVIYQYINNYENPGNIPEEEEEPGTKPSPGQDPAEEYKPDTTFLDTFMLPSLITNKFPFCIPFDVARALSLFDTNAREAPKWECDLHYGSNVYHLVIDLSQFNDIAAFLRSLEFILFVVGLAVGTRSLIRG